MSTGRHTFTYENNCPAVFTVSARGYDKFRVNVSIKLKSINKLKAIN